ncbi:MAG: hypothetical protein WAT74_03330 [Flavobacteriales bacterium]
MDRATAIVLILTIALLALPFALDYMSRRRKRSSLLKLLENAARSQQGHLHQHEVAGQVAMGLDSEKKLLFFINQQEQADAVLLVPLTEAQSCKLLVNERSARGELTDARIERVELVLPPKERAGTERRLMLYRESLGSLPNGEAQLASKWAALVNAVI